MGQRVCQPALKKEEHELGLILLQCTKLSPSLELPSSTFTQSRYRHSRNSNTDNQHRESGVERSKLFVTTKVMSNVGDIPAAIKSSLKKLQLDYVDL